ncbi:hypothetical protein WJX75_004333 [Coccomyxa subellipsoidea]|uniref:Magnesium transporter MgtE intracellular domain-containing protein n=1 Tax=Coccomyxa subellipsoidea TaxID=248742 RepID=A0ABR2YRD1_9CHLO
MRLDLSTSRSLLRPGDMAASNTRGQHEISPALKALSKLSHDDSGGWIRDLDRLQPKNSSGRRRPSLHRSGSLRSADQELRQGRRGSVDLESTWLSDISRQQLAGLGIISQPDQQLPLQRQLLHLRLLSCTADANGAPVGSSDASIPGLVVLPSDGPSGRQEALEVHSLLRSIAAAPAFAAERALNWREEVLERLCRRALDQPGGRGVHLRDHSPYRNGLSAILPDAVVGGMTQHHQGGPSGLGWDMRCMAGVLLGAGIAMADLIRQAEGACAERGTALAAAWNLHTSICDSMMERLREEATVQEQRNIALQAQVMHMQSAAEDNRQLQQDIERLSKEVQAHEVAAARAAIKETEAEEKLRSGLAELDMVERMARRQLAAMRWRQAMILQGSAHKQSLFRLPSAHGPCPQPVLQQVGMLQGTATALAVSTFRRDRTRAEQRRALQRASGDPLDPGARFASVVQDTMVGSAALVSAMAGDVKKAAQMLDTLAPEAQAMVLSTLAPAEQTGLLQGMSDEGAAACLAAMSLTARGGVIADLAAADPTLVTCTLAFIWQSPALAGKWLGSMAAREAARELLDNTDLLQQRQVLLRMKPHRAAALLEEMEAHTREGILQGLAPEATAAILQAMPRAMALSSLQALIKPIAQKVLACFGSAERAALLSHLSVSETLRLIQGWAPERQREFLHALPASIATEATVQLLLQSSHKWTYSSPIPVAGEGLSGEQEVDEEIDEEEVKELQEAAGRELRAAAAAVFGLPFEDKVKLVGALPPAAAAALTGTLTRQEGAQLLSELPQPQLVAVIEAMDPAQRAETEDALLALTKTGSPRRRSLCSILRPERPDTASSVASRASNVDAPADGGRRGSRLSIRAGGGAGALSTAAGLLLRDARSSRKSMEPEEDAKQRPSKFGRRKSMLPSNMATTP